MAEPTVTRVAAIEARYVPAPWDWARENAESIALNWERRLRDKPRMFNGQVLVQRAMQISGDICRMTYSQVDFAAFLAWTDLGYPDRSIANGFAAGALQDAQGALVCGVMGSHTVNAGRIYFAAGTPDMSDVRPDGSVDLAGSILRELEEETLLTPDDVTVPEGWLVVDAWPAIALLRPLILHGTAAEAAARIRGNIASQADPELCDVAILASPDDLDRPRMPRYMHVFVPWHFSHR